MMIILTYVYKKMDRPRIVKNNIYSYYVFVLQNKCREVSLNNKSDY